jgi:hypothetical protein
LTGLGIVIPKKQRKTRNPLMEIQLNEVVRMGIILWNMDLQKSMGTLLLKVQVSRINVRYSEQFMFIGLKILHPGKEAEDLLNRFIHDAQIQELKRLSKKNL